MKRNFLPVYAFSLALLLMLSVSCAKKLDDAKMSSEIRGRFSQDSGLASKQLTVQANNGVVTLSGTVDNAAQRDAAGQQAASVAGVKTVINNLEVGDASSNAATASQPAASVAANVAPDKPEAGTTLKKAEKPRREHAHTARNTDSDQNPQPPVAMNNPPTPDGSASAPPPASNVTVIPATPPPPPAPKKLIIDQGTQLAVRLIDPIDSEKNQVGDTFHATLNAALASDGQQAVPAGVEVTGHVVDVKSASKFAGKSLVVLQLDTLSAGGKRYDLQTDQYRKETATRGKNTAEKVGGGAVLGGIIGALAGGGKGAAIGAAAGAGVGGGVQAASKSQQIKLPSETVLNFTLQAPITVVEVESPDTNRPRLSTSQ
jgi:BON domain